MPADLWQAESMARGWENKAVESQIEEAESRAERAQATKLRPAELQIRQERESLELSRTRVLQDLAAAQNPKYRELLQRSLRYLDEKIASLTS
jgi:endonuclease I